MHSLTPSTVMMLLQGAMAQVGAVGGGTNISSIMAAAIACQIDAYRSRGYVVLLRPSTEPQITPPDYSSFVLR